MKQRPKIVKRCVPGHKVVRLGSEPRQYRSRIHDLNYYTSAFLAQKEDNTGSNGTTVCWAPKCAGKLPLCLSRSKAAESCPSPWALYSAAPRASLPCLPALSSVPRVAQHTQATQLWPQGLLLSSGRGKPAPDTWIELCPMMGSALHLQGGAGWLLKPISLTHRL
jgi:hypothetical protein